MSKTKINNKGQARLFENQLLERLTKANPVLIWAMYLPFLIYLPYYAIQDLHFTIKQTMLIFSAGIFFWTLAEYLIHRFIFHYQPVSEWGKKIHFLFHGNHHAFPRDKERLFMPPIPSLIISSFFFLFFYVLMRNNSFVFFPGFISGYLLYGTMHFAIHAYHPPFKWMKPLWRNHHLHHYKEEDKGFGVTSTLWDFVFRTRFDLKKEKEDQEKVKELMY
jgi:sterol desaturase/sphingolipid hydroxylase (fatty acid hydroxylase superfamily)